MHDHDHGHPHTHHEGTDASKLKAVLDYTASHTLQHAEELKALTAKLVSEGKAEASELLQDASELYKQANEKVKEALEKL